MGAVRKWLDSLSKTAAMVLTLAGMAIAIAVFAALALMDFTLADALWCVPALVLSALLVFGGARRLKR